MSTVVIMPGGFHPFHAGHMALYNSAREAFPGAEVYVAASNDTKTRPFPFELKEKLAKVAGVQPGHFVQVKSPFQPKEITQNYDPEKDIVIFVRSQKDMKESPIPGGVKKNGEPAYFQPFKRGELEPFGKHAYMAYLPTVEFGPGITSATEIRNAWPKLDDRRKTAMVMSLYPATQQNKKLADNVVKMLDLGMGNELDEDINRRGFLKSLGAGAMALSATPALSQQSQPSSNLSQYSIKRLRFGMTPKEVSDVTGKVTYDLDKLDKDKNKLFYSHQEEGTAILRDTNKRLEQARNEGSSNVSPVSQILRDKNEAIFKWREDECAKELDKLEKIEYLIKGYANKSDPKYQNIDIPAKYTKQGEDFDDLISNYSIAGNTFWKTIDKNGKLMGIYQNLHLDDVADTVQVFTNVYGKPNVRNQPVRTRMGYQTTNIIYYWKVKDATITIQKYAGTLDHGDVIILWDKANQVRSSEKQANVNKATKDFEENLNEFAPVGGDGREPDEEEILRQLAAQWYHGDEDPKAERTLEMMGWEIGHVESGDDDAGVFVVRAGDENGDSYIAFNQSDLNLNEVHITESVDYLEEK